MTAVLSVRDLCFSHPGDAPLFKALQVELPAGVSWLHGESGSGKTTLLNLLRGEQAVQGDISLSGVSLRGAAAAYRRLVFWHDPADARHDGLKPDEVAAAVRADHPGWDDAAWARHLDGFGLEPHRAKPLFALSTGTRRKVWLAAALSAGARLCLLDEPTAGLDRASADYLAQVLADPAWCESGTVVLVAAGLPLPGVPWAATLELAG